MQNSLEYIKKNKHTVVKKLGQNFLIDPNIINKIVNAQKINQKTCVIEIGPGLGALTDKLLSKAGYVVAYEIDKKLTFLLKKNFSNYKNIKIINKDFMKLNLEKEILKLKKDFNDIVVISNLPYYLSSQMIVKTLESSRQINSCIFMVQKEFGERLAAKVSTKKYNNFSILVNYYANIQKLFTVSSNVFIPKPKVNSVVVKFTIKKKRIKINNEKHFFRFLKDIFQQKRKTILNNLSNVIGNKKRANIILEKIKIDQKLRPENLNINQFINIYNEMEKS